MKQKGKNIITISLNEKELKLIKKSLINQKMTKLEEIIWFSIQDKINNFNEHSI